MVIGASTDFPIGGDAIVLRNTNGTEQYVRVLKTSSVSGQYSVDADVIYATIVTCDLGQALAYDFIGPPMVKIIEQSAWASVYSTTLASGARFYGIKPLGANASVGDISATVSGGIYTPLVPAATISSPTSRSWTARRFQPAWASIRNSPSTAWPHRTPRHWRASSAPKCSSGLRDAPAA